MKNHVWIVEMFCLCSTGSRWQPTVGCRRIREEGYVELAVWRKRNPDDKFRLRCYEAV